MSEAAFAVQGNQIPTHAWSTLDIEYVGQPFDGRLLCVGLDDTAYGPELSPEAQEVLADPSVIKVTFTKADHRWLRLAGYEVNGPIHDVQVMAWLLDEAQDLDLESCALRYCGIRMDKRISSVAGKPVFRCDDGSVVPLGVAPIDQVCAYNERDLSATASLYVELWGRLAEAGMLDHFLTEQVPFTSVLLDMETTGIPVDLPATQRLREELSAEIARLGAELHESAGLPDAFNLNSATQLSDYLFSKTFRLKASIDVPEVVAKAPKDERIALMKERAPRNFFIERVGTKYAHGHYDLAGLGLKVHAKTDSGKPSTAAPKLRTYYQGNDWIARLLELKERSTIVGTFLENFERRAVDGRLYGYFKQTGTVTGRLSSSEPNIQNIPSRTDLGKRVRELFRFDGVYGIHADYSQLEPRLMAHWSQDLVLLDVFRSAKDIYQVTAAYIFGVDIDDVSPEQRGICKTAVLAMGYGSGAAKFAMILTERGYPTDEKMAGGYLRELKQLYKTFFAWKEQVIRGAGLIGYVETLAGRRRRLVSGDDRAAGGHWKGAELSETQAVNAVIQGSAADIVQRVMVRSSRDLPHFGLVAQVHDELLWQSEKEPAPFELFKLQRIAETGHGFRLSVPLVFEPKVVDTWAAGK